MIKAQDLRLGNYILHDGNPYKVVRLNDAEVSFFNEKDKCRWTVTSNKVEPIELTPELLRKAGFDLIGNSFWRKGGFLLFIHEDGLMFQVGNQIVSYNPINYLHQLQNLFYALAGTELSITL